MDDIKNKWLLFIILFCQIITEVIVYTWLLCYTLSRFNLFSLNTAQVFAITCILYYIKPTEEQSDANVQLWNDNKYIEFTAKVIGKVFVKAVLLWIILEVGYLITT